MSKIVIAIIAIIIAIGIGSGFSQVTLAPKEKIKDEISVVLENLKKETGIDFSEIKEVDFKWVVRVDPELKDETVSGKGFEANFISDEQYDSIEQFLINNGFAVDIYNTTAGTVAELVGYRKEKNVCTVSGGISGYKEADTQWEPSEINTKDVIVNCGKVKKTEMEYATEDWQIYINKKYGYYFKYPADCFYGPLPSYCKQTSPEERPRECLCYLNAENPDEVSLGTFTGTKSNLVGASFSVSHYSSRSYDLPVDIDFINWLKEEWSYLDFPDETNMELGGLPVVKVYTPQSPMAWSQDDIFFIRNNRVLKMSILNVDDEYNKEFYDQILFTFNFNEEAYKKEQACIISGGATTTSLCCESTENYPNLCFVGPCGCSPDSSHEVKICDCGEEKCFNGDSCVILQDK